MSLSADEVRRIAYLARLRLAPEEVDVLVPQLAQILDYFDQLARYSGVEEEPAASLSLEAEDRARGSMPRRDFLANAPQSLDTFVLVPQVKTTSDE